MAITTAKLLATANQHPTTSYSLRILHCSTIPLIATPTTTSAPPAISTMSLIKCARFYRMPRPLRRFAIPLATAVILLLIWAVSTLSASSNSFSSGSMLVDSYTHLMMPEEAHLRDKAAQAQMEAEAQINDPCTVYHPVSHQFIDLREISRLMSLENTPSIAWHARAFDDHARNYTLGICTSPFKHEGVFGDEVNSTAVGAYYTDTDKKLVSIGEYSSSPKFHGRKMALTYGNGSYCPNIVDSNGEPLRRQTIITFTCTRDLMARASVHFIAHANECTYVFEVRSHHACPMAPRSNNMAAVLIFALIISAAAFVVWLVNTYGKSPKPVSEVKEG